MGEAANAVEGVAGLLLGGFILLTVGSTLASSLSSPPLIDFRLWGVVYIFAAFVLGGVTVLAAAARILS